MQKIVKRTIDKTKKRFRSLYKKSPVLVLATIIIAGVLILGGSAYGVYRLVTPTNQPAESVAVDEISADQQSDEESPDDTQAPDAEESIPKSPTSTTCTYSGTLENITRYPIILGGPAGTNIYSSAIIQETSKRPITPLRLSTDPSMSSSSQSLDLSGLHIYEGKSSSRHNVGDSIVHRSLVFDQKTSTSSGNTTIYVSDQCGSKPVAIDVSWSPYPKFLSVEETGHSRVVNGDTESYTFNFKITPNAYFGTPRMSVLLRGYYTDYCDSESVTSIKTNYDGTNTFTLTCQLEVPPCTNPNPDNCKPLFYAHVFAFPPNIEYGDGVPGGKSFTYDFSE